MSSKMSTSVNKTNQFCWSTGGAAGTNDVTNETTKVQRTLSAPGGGGSLGVCGVCSVPFSVFSSFSSSVFCPLFSPVPSGSSLFWFAG